MCFELLERWGSSSMDSQMICRSMITASPVTCPSLPIDSLTASRSWAIGCQATAWGWIHRRLNSSGWVRHRRLARCTFDPITIDGETIQPSQTVRDLGAYINSSIGFPKHVTKLVKTCYFHIRQFRSVSQSLTIESSHTLVRALVLTCLDYCNRLLGGPLKCRLSPLSGILQAAARLILLLPRTSSVANRIRTILHLLDIPLWVTFVLARISMPPWVYSGLRWSVPSLDNHISDLQHRVCYLCQERIPRQLTLEHSRSHPQSLKLICSTCHPFSYFVLMNYLLIDQHSVVCCSWHLFLVIFMFANC